MVMTTEHDHQKMLVQWLRAKYGPHACFAVPNGAQLGGKNRFAQLNKLKAEGLLPGSPDLVIGPRAWGTVPGEIVGPILIEMKAEGGTVSDDQRAVHDAWRKWGWRVIVSYGFDDAKRRLEDLGL